MVEIVAELAVFTFGHTKYMLNCIRAAKKVGCTGVKLQIRTPSAIYTDEKLNSKYDSMFGTTYREYREGLEHDPADFTEASALCRELGLDFYVSVYDLEAYVSIYYRADYKAIKVPGSRLHDVKLLKSLNLDAKDNVIKPSIILSVGSKSIEEIEKAVSYLPNFSDIVICHTVNNYPTADSDVLLGNLDVLIDNFAKDRRIRLGYSGHDMNPAIGAAANEMGCTYIERHFALNRRQLPVHHSESCWTPDEMAEQVAAIQDNKRALKLCDVPAQWPEPPPEWMRSGFGVPTDYTTGQQLVQR
jgi:sialic acid synthase SpsE